MLDRRHLIAGLGANIGLATLDPASLLARPASALTVEPEDFGPVADGRGDAAAAINSALAALVAAGGGTLRFRSGKTYRLETTSPRTAETHPDFLASLGLPAGARDLVIDLNGATLLQVADAYSIGSAFSFFNTRQLAPLVRGMRGTPRRGDTHVELAAGQPAPQPGAIVMLVAGNTVPQDYAPVAEMQVVRSVSGQTVEFDRPLAKNYRPFGRTFFGAVPYGLLDVTGQSMRNIELTGPGRIVNTRRRAGNIAQVLGLLVRGVTCEGRGGLMVRGRDLQVFDCSARIQADWSKPVYRPYCLALDTGTSHAVVDNFTADGGTGVTYLHLHEGLADVQVRNLSISNGRMYDPSGENPGAISILSTSQDVLIDGARILNNPQGAAISALQSRIGAGGNAGLVLRNIVIEGEFRLQPVQVTDDSTVVLENIDVSGARFLLPPGARKKVIVGGRGVRLGQVTGDDST